MYTTVQSAINVIQQTHRVLLSISVYITYVNGAINESELCVHFNIKMFENIPTYLNGYFIEPVIRTLCIVTKSEGRFRRSDGAERASTNNEQIIAVHIGRC